MRDGSLAFGGSLVIHAAAAVALALWTVSPAERDERERVVVRFTPLTPAVALPAGQSAAPTERGAPGSDSVSLPRLDRPQLDQRPGMAEVGEPSTAVKVERSGFGSRELKSVGEPGRSAPDPVKPAAPRTLRPELGPSNLLGTLEMEEANGVPESGGQLSEAGQQVVIEGTTRKLLRRGSMRFPPDLAAGGQEFDVEADISIDGSGRVVGVVLRKRSGRSESDLQIEQVLRGFVFDATGSDIIEKGVVRIRFRLEKNL